jgi:hypothetical protein
MTNSRDEIGFLPNGEYIKLGNYYDLIIRHDIKKKLRVFFDFDFKCRNCKKKCSEDGTPKQIEQTEVGEIPPAKYEIIFRCGTDFQPELEKITIYDCLDRILLSRRKTNSNKYYTLDFYRTIDDTDKNTYDFILKQMPQNYIFSEQDILDSVFQMNREKYSKSTGIKFDKSISRYLDVIAANKQNVLNKLSRIKYVGPIREEAKRIYEYNKKNYSARLEDLEKLLPLFYFRMSRTQKKRMN